MGESTDLIVGRRTRVHVVTHEEEETSPTEIETVRPTSAAYLGNPATWKKRSVILGLSALVIAVAGVSLGLRYFGNKRANAFEPFSKLKMARLTTTGRANDAAISPDGKFVVHVMDNAGEQSLWLRHIPTGSDQEIVPSNKDGFLGLTFSPDGNRIYFLSLATLYEVPVLGGPRRSC
jgi:hypothetical protein